MITNIIDLTVYIKGNPLSPINTEVSVRVNWDLEINKGEAEAKLKYSFHSVAGKFMVHETKELYSKTTEYKFHTDETWEISHVPYCADTISPTSAIINFDDKTIKIKF